MGRLLIFTKYVLTRSRIFLTSKEAGTVYMEWGLLAVLIGIGLMATLNGMAQSIFNFFTTIGGKVQNLPVP